MKRLVPLMLALLSFLALSVPVLAADDDPQDAADDLAPVSDTYTIYSLDESEPVQDEDAAQLPAALVALFGEYQPRTQTVTEYLSDGSSVSYQEIIPGVAGMDMEWIASVVLFVLVVFCVFKLIGGVLKS